MSTLLYPPSIDWEITSGCNHNCIHCYNYWRTQTNDHSIGNTSFYEKIANKIIQSKPVSVQITGGEPLIKWSSITGAIRNLIEAGINVSINTNAALVTDDIARFLAENNVDAFVSIPCSRPEIFDRVVNCKGASKRVFSGIDLFVKHGVRISLNMVVTKINYPYIYETACFVKERFGVTYFSATKASFPQNADADFKNQILNLKEFNEMLETLLRIKHETGMRVDSAWVYSSCGFSNLELLNSFGFNRKCGCGRYTFVIDSKGNIKACGCDDRTYGNILENSFSDSIAKMVAWQNASMLPPECITCSFMKYCGGGCRMDGKGNHGIDNSVDSTANPAHKALLKKNSSTEKLSKDTFISLNPSATFVKEKCGYRISYKTNYEYVSDTFYTFICTNQCFILSSILNYNETINNDIIADIKKLVHKKLLKISTGTVTDGNETTNLSQDIYPLIVSPYIDFDSSDLIKDYASSEIIFKRFV